MTRQQNEKTAALLKCGFRHSAFIFGSEHGRGGTVEVTAACRTPRNIYMSGEKRAIEGRREASKDVGRGMTRLSFPFTERFRQIRIFVSGPCGSLTCGRLALRASTPDVGSIVNHRLLFSTRICRYPQNPIFFGRMSRFQPFTQPLTHRIEQTQKIMSCSHLCLKFSSSINVFKKN
jgi:hypothetical protein